MVHPQRKTVPDGRVSGARKLARTATVRMCISPQVSDITSAGCTPRHFARFLETLGASDQDGIAASKGSTLALSNSNLARPYIWRLMTLSRLICPSTGPLLHRMTMEQRTAFRSRCRVVANCATDEKAEPLAFSIHCRSRRDWRHRSIARNCKTKRRSL